MTTPFVVGDTVRLKSGGPLMTVSRVGSTYDVEDIGCAWFVGTKQHSGDFAAGALEKSGKATASRTIAAFGSY